MGDQVRERVAVIELVREILAAPHVLADCYAADRSGDFERLAAGGRLKIACFVEDIVGGEQRFEDFPRGLSPLEYGGGIAEGAPWAGIHVHVPHDEGDGAHLRLDRGKCREVVRDEAGLKKQIQRRVAWERQLRRQHHIGTPRDQVVIGPENFRAVSGEIADGRIDLG